MTIQLYRIKIGDMQNVLISRGYKQSFEEDDMALLRSRHSLDEVRRAYSTGDADMKLRSYHLPKYQQDMIEVLADDSGLSRAGVIRQIIDEWYELKVASENGND